MRKLKRHLAGAMAVCMIATSLVPSTTAFADEFQVSTESVASSAAEDAENAESAETTAKPTPAPSENPVSSDSDSEVSSEASSSESTDSASSEAAESEAASSGEEENTPDPTPVPSAEPDSSASSEVTDASSEITEPEETETPADSEAAEDETPTMLIDSFALIDPEYGNTLEANLGEEATLTAKGTRDDVEVEYQWQVFRDKMEDFDYDSDVEEIYDYQDLETWYSFPLDDVTEAETLQENPDATWPGIETYYAVVEALDEAGEDSSKVQIAYQTTNFALEGYTIIAKKTDDGVEIYADKDEDDSHYISYLNEEGKYAFKEVKDDAEKAADAEEETSEESVAASSDDLYDSWEDIEGANEDTYTFVVQEEDFYSTYRCKVTIKDEEYLSECLKILESQGYELTDEQKAADQILYSISMNIHSDEWDEYVEQQKSLNGENLVATYAVEASDHPKLSKDTQWIQGLNNTYEYITKDTYEKINEWVKTGDIANDTEYNRYWTRLGNGFNQYGTANVLDNEGKPVHGQTRKYNGVDLTDGAMEVLSEWYGKTVLFRVHGSNNITEIKIPAYTDLTVDDEGNYVEAASGTKYKKAVTILNAYVKGTIPQYKNYLTTATSNGWLKGTLSKDNDAHVQMYIVDCESFNKDPQRYMVDAEGNYRVDSFAWGVCTYQEPDISGKAYWCLKDYLGNGYGFMIGHDTLYAYAGAYYDALRNADLDYSHDDPTYWRTFRESEINPNDEATWYYNINSWTPNGSSNIDSPDNNWPWYRGGHWYLNQLMGSNKGNVYSGTTKPSDAPSLILSTGGSHGKYGKRIMYGSTTLGIVQRGYTTEQAVANPKYRTPTNYPYVFNNDKFTASETHSNGQAAFGPIWVNYAGANFGASNGFGCYPDPKYWTIDGKTGTNNFYLSGNGNFLMNQIGHLPHNSSTPPEARLLVNSIMYISQRKQCEICAAEQNSQSDTHFVRRVNSANKDEIFEALQNGGNFWYKLDGCYMLTENITLPDDWKSIEGFTGHWDNDVYKITLGKNKEPFFAKTETNWDLGTDPSKGIVNVFDKKNQRITGVARVVGDLNDLFSTNMNYAGYTVKIFAKDNKYLSNGPYTCTVNSDSKYVISNLPCIYDGINGILRAHVYDPSGNEVTQYGEIRVNVAQEFWNTNDTIPLYLYEEDVHAAPIPNRETYEGEPAVFTAQSSHDKEIPASGVKWQWREDEYSDWKEIATGPWGNDYKISKMTYTEDDMLGYIATQTLTLNHPVKAWNGYQFRTCTTVDGFGTINSWEYYKVGKEYVTINGYDVAAAAAAAGTTSTNITTYEKKGELTVKPWPFKVYQSPDQEVWVTENAQFTVEADYWKGIDDGLTIEWQTRPNNSRDTEWESVNFAGYNVSSKSVDQDIAVYQSIKKNYNFDTVWQKHTTTTLTIPKCDLDYYGYYFRVHFTYISNDGTVYEWYSSDADNVGWKWDIPVTVYGETLRGAAEENREGLLKVKGPYVEVALRKAEDEPGSKDHQETITPDKYGQFVEIQDPSMDYYKGTVYYTAIIHYYPGNDILNVVPQWQYRTFLNSKFNNFTDAFAKKIDSRISVNVNNTDLGILKPGDKYYDARFDGYPAIKSVMTITNPTLSMYDTTKMKAYYFRCTATAKYKTALGQRQYLAKSENEGDLIVDYNISLHHNGVNTYKKQNIINSGDAYTVDDIARLTSGKNYSDWQYPKLEIKDPKSINTILVQFTSESFNSNDTIYVDTSFAESIGVSVSGNGKSYTFRAKTENTVATGQWQNLLRRITFRTYDPITFTDNKVSGGVSIMWYADENVLGNNIFYNSSTGHFYQYLHTGTINWNTARERALNMYNEMLETYGYLAHVTSIEEWNYIMTLARGSYGWLGASRSFTRQDGTSISGWDWYWVDGPKSEQEKPFFHQSGVGGSLLWGFSNWKGGEPNNSGNETVLHFYPDTSWNDFNVGNGEVGGFVVEWGDDDIVGIKPTNHSVVDYDTIGTQATVPVQKYITTNVTGGTKMYDGTELMPTITISSDTVANPAQYVNAVYTCSTSSAQYAGKTLSSSATSGDGVINYGNYTVTLSLTDAGIAAGIQLTTDSVTTAKLKITKRPINIYSRNNNKVYDGNDRATVRNIQVEAPSGNHGLIGNDKVTLTPTTISGNYETKHKGTELQITINGTIGFATNPYNNYYIDRESYTGNILARPLYVHSKYLEDKNNPKNVKEYDSTTAATITDILIDNIVGGDTVWVNKDTYNGFYETAESGEQLRPNGKPYGDRDWRLNETKITRDPKDIMELINNPYGDYYIASEDYSGGILRTTLEIRINEKTIMYGSEDFETPYRARYFDSSSDSGSKDDGSANKVDGWLHIYGLQGSDSLTLTNDKVKFGAFDKNGKRIVFEQRTPVGEYLVTVEGITEENYNVLRNYLIAQFDGHYNIIPRPVTVTAKSFNWYTDDSRNPRPVAKFELLADDEETLIEVGDDKNTDYADMNLILDDTVSQYIRVIGKGEAIPTTESNENKLMLRQQDTLYGREEFGSGDSKHLVMYYGTNIRYSTFWYQFAPAKFLDNSLASDRVNTPLCNWCSNYHNTEIGANHAALDGYEIKVNQDIDEGKILTVATVENLLGETVQNYELRYVSGKIMVHPILDIQLDVTVPMYVCMYGYRGDGEVVEPTTYGITNYTRNSPIVIDNLNVGKKDGQTAGWNIVNKLPKDLQRGEMSMLLSDTQLVMGDQSPANFENWLIRRDNSKNHKGVKLTLPITSYIAGGNVNDAGEDFVTKVTYTVRPYTRRPLPTTFAGGKQQSLEDGSALVVMESAEDVLTEDYFDLPVSSEETPVESDVTVVFDEQSVEIEEQEEHLDESESVNSEVSSEVASESVDSENPEPADDFAA